MQQSSKAIFDRHHEILESNKELAYMLVKDSSSMLTANNDVKVLVNGENKFVDVLAALEKAKDHIHIEYYIYEDDETGQAVEKLLIKKASEGVKVRFIYDDFGSKKIRNSLAKRLRAGGVEAYPFYKIRFVKFASRLNYRNHRKIIIVDGSMAFTGGINVSDRYVNAAKKKNKVFWRDTHLSIEGSGVTYLQYIFICDWNFCSGQTLQTEENFFPPASSLKNKGKKIVQIAASGPDSDHPTILYTFLQAINLAYDEILITTPYFIPGQSLLDALIVASLGGVKVKLLVPGKSDSALVNAAARSYYEDLLRAGVEIYLYNKGFVHAKSLVADSKVAIVGTANMDARSFELNFEVNAVIYDDDIANELRDVFLEDIKDAEKIDIKQWESRPMHKQLFEKMARLLSPVM